MNNLKDLETINLVMHKDERGELLPIEFQKNFKIPIKRSFLVYGRHNVVRGNHAHKLCNQFLCCLNGICEVNCDDGKESNKEILDNPTKILKIPNMIWSSQRYLSENSIILVLCDLDYSEEDYIRDYEDFINYRKNYPLI